MSRTYIRVPFDPLEPQLLEDYGDNHTEWAVCLRVQRSYLLEVRKRGWMSLELAERFAHELGLHPLEIWVDYYELAGAA